MPPRCRVENIEFLGINFLNTQLRWCQSLQLACLAVLFASLCPCRPCAWYSAASVTRPAPTVFWYFFLQVGALCDVEGLSPPSKYTISGLNVRTKASLTQSVGSSTNSFLAIYRNSLLSPHGHDVNNDCSVYVRLPCGIAETPKGYFFPTCSTMLRSAVRDTPIFTFRPRHASRAASITICIRRVCVVAGRWGARGQVCPHAITGDHSK